jgi:hypothetical protein
VAGQDGSGASSGAATGSCLAATRLRSMAAASRGVRSPADSAVPPQSVGFFLASWKSKNLLCIGRDLRNVIAHRGDLTDAAKDTLERLKKLVIEEADPSGALTCCVVNYPADDFVKTALPSYAHGP